MFLHVSKRSKTFTVETSLGIEEIHKHNFFSQFNDQEASLVPMAARELAG